MVEILPNGYYEIIDVQSYGTYADFYDVFGLKIYTHTEVDTGITFMSQSTNLAKWGENFCQGTSTNHLTVGWYRYTDHSGTQWCSKPTVTSPATIGAPVTPGTSVLETGSCTPNWQCEYPLNGYESDGCGNRRANPACNPDTSGGNTSNLLIYGVVAALIVLAVTKRGVSE